MIVHDTQPASLLPLPSLPDESEEAAPVNVFAQLFNMFLAPPSAAQIAPPAPADSATRAFSMLPSAAPASDPAHLIGAEAIRLDEKFLGIRDLPALPTSELSGFTIAESATIAPALVGAELLQRDGKSLSVNGLPDLPTSELSGFTFAESAATTPTFAGPVIEKSQEAVGAARSQATGDTQSTDAVDAVPEIMAHRPQRDDRPPANGLAETGLAGTPQMTVTQPLIGAAPPAMFEAPAKSDVGTDMRQSTSRLNKSAGLDGSAMPRSPIVDMPTSLASETAPAVESQPLVLLNQANDDLTTKQQVELPIAARKAPAWSDDRDGFKAQSLRTEDHSSMAVNDSSIANATAALKQSDGMRHLPFTEPPLEMAPEANPATPGKADASTVRRDAEKIDNGIAAVSAGDGAAKDDWEGQPREGDPRTYPSMVVDTVPARIHESHRGQVSVPAWRPMVERLARDIGEHFRVGERQAVLQLDPPELGKVKIELRIEEGQLLVRIAAEGEESQGLIERHLPELHQALRAGQIDVGEVRVTQDEWKGSGDPAQGFSQSPQGRQESSRDVVNSGVADEAMTEPLAQPVGNSDGRVSMWA